MPMTFSFDISRFNSYCVFLPDISFYDKTAVSFILIDAL